MKKINEKIKKLLCCLIIFIICSINTFADLDDESIENGFIVVQKGDEFLDIELLESEDHVYLEMIDIMNVLDVKIIKDGLVYKIVDSKYNIEVKKNTEEQQAVFLGTYNDDGTYKQGQIFWLSGRAYNGTFENNLPSGLGEMIFENGDVYKGSFDKGLPHGQGQLFYKDGSNYLGQMRYGTVTGYGRIRYSNNDVYKGYLYMGIFHGAGAFSEHDGGTKQGLWEYGTYIKYLSDKDMDLYMFDK